MLNVRPGAALRALLGSLAAVLLLGTAAAHAQDDPTIIAAYPNTSGGTITPGVLTIPTGQMAITTTSATTSPET